MDKTALASDNLKGDIFIKLCYTLLFADIGKFDPSCSAISKGSLVSKWTAIAAGCGTHSIV